MISPDGTELELLRFDFKSGHGLRFGIYDQDQDDSAPFDNKVDYFDHSVGWVTKHLNSSSRRVLFASNGPFFAFDHPPESPKNGWARHIGPVVIDGAMHANVGQHRWTFGVKYSDQGFPSFETLFLPDAKTLGSKFDFAADGVQCLVKEGKPRLLAKIEKKTFDTDKDVGSIPIVDQIKTSRVSLGWSKDSRYLYALIISEPDSETGSINELRRGLQQEGGWSTADLQRFWTKLGVWGAINSDGGMETQRTLLQKDGSYDLLTPLSSGERGHVKLIGDGPGGGTLLSFYVAAAG
jgi:hypothetical protein